ncbi:MAG: hypothetical protein WC635_11960 [Bacteriovorax sp.]|jgi:hypothetical protein
MNIVAEASTITLLIAVNEKVEYYQSLEKTFREEFQDSTHQLNIIKKANILQIQKELLNPENLAVYLVAHSGSESNDSGLTKAIIIDSDHLKLNDVLKTVHPNLAFFGLIGCKGKTIIENFKRDFYPKKTEVFGFSEIVEARNSILFKKMGNGLKKTIEFSRQFLTSEQQEDQSDLNSEETSDTVSSSSTILHIEKPATLSDKWLQIRIQNKVIAILSPEMISLDVEIAESDLTGKFIVAEFIALEDFWKLPGLNEVQMEFDNRPVRLLTTKKGNAVGQNMALWRL